MLLSRRNPEAAIPEFRKAIELNPKFPTAHLSLAVAYSHVGQYLLALEEVHKAEQLGSDPTRVLETWVPTLPGMSFGPSSSFVSN